MKFLLSNGLSTSNKDVYIKDVLDLNFSIFPRDIPYNSVFGIERRVHSVSDSEFMDNLRTNITSLLDRINERHQTTLSITSMVRESTVVKLEINLGYGETINYSI